MKTALPFCLSISFIRFVANVILSNRSPIDTLTSQKLIQFCNHRATKVACSAHRFNQVQTYRIILSKQMLISHVSSMYCVVYRLFTATNRKIFMRLTCQVHNIYAIGFRIQVRFWCGVYLTCSYFLYNSSVDEALSRNHSRVVFTMRRKSMNFYLFFYFHKYSIIYNGSLCFAIDFFVTEKVNNEFLATLQNRSTQFR